MRADYRKADDPVWSKVHRLLARGLSQREAAERTGLTKAQIKGKLQSERGTRSRRSTAVPGWTRQSLREKVYRFRCGVCGTIYGGPLLTNCPQNCAAM